MLAATTAREPVSELLLTGGHPLPPSFTSSPDDPNHETPGAASEARKGANTLNLLLTPLSIPTDSPLRCWGHP